MVGVEGAGLQSLTVGQTRDEYRKTFLVEQEGLEVGHS